MTLFLIILLASEVSSLTLRKPKHRWWNDLSDNFYPADCCNIVLIEFLSSFSKQTNNLFVFDYLVITIPIAWQWHPDFLDIILDTEIELVFLNFGIIWLTLKSLHGQSIGMVLMTNGWMVIFLKGHFFQLAQTSKYPSCLKHLCSKKPVPF